MVHPASVSTSVVPEHSLTNLASRAEQSFPAEQLASSCCSSCTRAGWERDNKSRHTNIHVYYVKEKLCFVGCFGI